MALGVATEIEGRQYSGRMTPFVVISCMMAAMGGLIYGYDSGISASLSLYKRNERRPTRKGERGVRSVVS
ncbi:hypothetical protein L1049_020469 [Liquidambar formosana]|uniref:Major facilitator superfamily (MFS) profile domain-containing protein n=1 Tax=Liquidambar formosana TaxID=63359 RepID=A0AAP0X616_LIQFO